MLHLWNCLNYLISQMDVCCICWSQLYRFRTWPVCLCSLSLRLRWDQQSANVLRKQLGALSRKINIAIEPVFKSHKLQDEFRSNEPKPNIINQQCVVYEFQCPLCDARYVGYTTRHLFQRIEEHRLQSSSIGKHLKSHHPVETPELTSHFKILKKCRGKLECLIFEMLLIKELNPSLNKQSDSIKAKVFI